VELVETFIAPDVFALLPDEDKQTINELKMKAVGLWLTRKP
jgi:hypothetical protein